MIVWPPHDDSPSLTTLDRRTNRPTHWDDPGDRQHQPKKSPAGEIVAAGLKSSFNPAAHVAWAEIKLEGLPVERQRTSGLLEHYAPERGRPRTEERIGVGHGPMPKLQTDQLGQHLTSIARLRNLSPFVWLQNGHVTLSPEIEVRGEIANRVGHVGRC